MITLLVITDGRRECLEHTLDSFTTNVDQSLIEHTVIVNDSPDPDYRDFVDDLGFDLHVPPAPRKRGFAGAIAAGWANLIGTEYVFHLEDDFTFNRTVDLPALAGVLQEHPHLVQMALRRQPWNELEIEAGGVVESHPDWYEDATDGTHHWLEHRAFFTTNPSLYPTWVTALGWPQCPNSEGVFSHLIFGDAARRSGYWGHRDDAPWVHHIGAQRIGIGH